MTLELPGLIFAVTLAGAALISERAQRSILSTAVLFLVVGFVAGAGVLRVLPPGRTQVVAQFAELALFSVLFVEGMRLPIGKLKRAWHLPGGALVVGLPLTVLGTAVAARLLTGLPWLPALLLGAVLSPTDPVFASAVVARPQVPWRLRYLLNVESGVNDGLALPVVVSLLALVGGTDAHLPSVLSEVVAGIVIGVVVPAVILVLARSSWFGISGEYRAIEGIAIGLLVLALTSVVHANEFLGAFAAGVTVASIESSAAAAFKPVGDTLAEVLKVAAVFVFGAFLPVTLFTGTPLGGYLFALVALVVVRPLALLLPLWHRLSLAEFVVASWFGPKGFASVFFGLLILKANVPDSAPVFNLAALVIVGSIVAHSSTDVLVARWFAPPAAGTEETDPSTAAR